MSFFAEGITHTKLRFSPLHPKLFLSNALCEFETLPGLVVIALRHEPSYPLFCCLLSTSYTMFIPHKIFLKQKKEPIIGSL